MWSGLGKMYVWEMRLKRVHRRQPVTVYLKDASCVSACSSPFTTNVISTLAPCYFFQACCRRFHPRTSGFCIFLLPSRLPLIWVYVSVVWKGRNKNIHQSLKNCWKHVGNVHHLHAWFAINGLKHAKTPAQPFKSIILLCYSNPSIINHSLIPKEEVTSNWQTI